MEKRAKFRFFTSLDGNVWINRADLEKYITSESRLSKIRLLVELDKCVYQEDGNGRDKSKD